jgi:hypothetical protein
VQERWELEGVEHAREMEMQPRHRAGGRPCADRRRDSIGGVQHVRDAGSVQRGRRPCR